jgi:hypothetical protein
MASDPIAATTGTVDPAAVSKRPVPASSGERERRSVWSSFWLSRVLVVTTGMAAMIDFGISPSISSSYTAGVPIPGGYFVQLLLASSARWDASWYLQIANSGYGSNLARTAFFPLYPLLIHVVAWVVRSPVIAGALISLAAFAVALTLLYRLVRLDHSPRIAQVTVMLLAFFPMALFFSAVYTESLFLALSLATTYAARQGRWVWAGVFGMLAALTRDGGVLLFVPVVLLMLYGPRADGERWRWVRSGLAADGAEARAGDGLAGARVERLGDGPAGAPAGAPAYASAGTRQRRGWGVLLPTYRVPLRGYAALLIPAGLLAYLGYLQIRYSAGTMPFRAESLWFHQSMTPVEGIWKALVAGWDGAMQVLHGPNAGYVHDPEQSAIAGGLFNFVMALFLIPAAFGAVGVFRRQPAAYGFYVLLGLLMPLSDPVTPQPLQSFPRYMMVLFPLFIWAATELERRRWTAYALAGSGLMLGYCTAMFATWRLIV